MSTCISRHGEYSEHTLDDAYACTRCSALDEDAMRAEIERLRGELAEAKLVLEGWEQVGDEISRYIPEHYEASEGALMGIIADWAKDADTVISAAKAWAETERHRSPATMDSSIWLEEQHTRAGALLTAVDAHNALGKATGGIVDSPKTYLVGEDDWIRPAVPSRCGIGSSPPLTDLGAHIALPIKACPDCRRFRMQIENITIAYQCPECYAAEDVHIAPSVVDGQAARGDGAADIETSTTDGGNT